MAPENGVILMSNSGGYFYIIVVKFKLHRDDMKQILKPELDASGMEGLCVSYTIFAFDSDVLKLQ